MTSKHKDIWYYLILNIDSYESLLTPGHKFALDTFKGT